MKWASEVGMVSDKGVEWVGWEIRWRGGNTWVAMAAVPMGRKGSRGVLPRGAAPGASTTCSGAGHSAGCSTVTQSCAWKSRYALLAEAHYLDIDH